MYRCDLVLRKEMNEHRACFAFYKDFHVQFSGRRQHTRQVQGEAIGTCPPQTVASVKGHPLEGEEAQQRDEVYPPE